jgi:hypothetical protein
MPQSSVYEFAYPDKQLPKFRKGIQSQNLRMPEVGVSIRESE